MDVKLFLVFNQSINQSWIYIAHTRKASNALVLRDMPFSFRDNIFFAAISCLW